MDIGEILPPVEISTFTAYIYCYEKLGECACNKREKDKSFIRIVLIME